MDGRGYVLADRSCRLSPDGWAKRVSETYHEFEADRVIVEANQGCETLSFVLGTVDSTVPVKRITASRGKKLRAEPVAALYEQGKISHIGVLPELEDQMRSFTGVGFTTPSTAIICNPRRAICVKSDACASNGQNFNTPCRS